MFSQSGKGVEASPPQYKQEFWMRKQGKTYQVISDELSKSIRKKFPVSWIFKIIKREGVELKVA